MSYVKHRQRVALRVVEARKAAGFSQEAFAVKVAITRRHLSRIETGRNLPGPKLLTRIAEATGKPESFFESDDDEEAARMSAPRNFLEELHAQLGAALRQGTGS